LGGSGPSPPPPPTTRDILLRGTAPAHGFVHRVSLAAIERDCDFSSYPDIDRTLVLACGAGFTLASPDAPQHELAPATPIARFPGETLWRCRLRDGPVRALNVLSARGRGTHTVRLLDAARGFPIEHVAGVEWVLVALDDGIALAGASLGRFDAALALPGEVLAGAGVVALVSLSTLC
jgi:environmental stress-induced protein Ves